MQITTTITHAESSRKLGKALESVSHINCTLLISFHPNSIHVIYYSQWNISIVDTEGRYWVLTPLIFGMFMLYSILFKILNQKNNIDCNSSNLWSFQGASTFCRLLTGFAYHPIGYFVVPKSIV